VQTLTKNQVNAQPSYAIPNVWQDLGLSLDDVLTQVWFVAANGRLLGGAAAVNAALSYCWWLRPFTSLYPIPGIRQLQDAAYRWVANNRYRLPGSTPQCKLPTQP
jgi:predicted DCC family thiol-disulfide oxidoreductase YuxK